MAAHVFSALRLVVLHLATALAVGSMGQESLDASCSGGGVCPLPPPRGRSLIQKGDVAMSNPLIAEESSMGAEESTSDKGPEKLWDKFGPKKRVCIKIKKKIKVKSQMDCQKIAVANGHAFYQYKKWKKKGKCNTMNTCTNTRRIWGKWRIYSADIGAATKAKAGADAARAAESKRIDKLTSSWPTSPWPQCSWDKHMCTDKGIKFSYSMMHCQKLARSRLHPYFQYTKWDHRFGLCTTAAKCDRPVPYAWTSNGKPSHWKIYTWGKCVLSETRPTTTTTTVTQAQKPVDTSMGTQTAVGGCSDPGKRPDSAGDAWRAGSATLGYGLEVRVFKVPGVPHNPSKHFNHGPTQRELNWGYPKQYYPVSRTDGKEGVVWSDASNKKVYMTWFADDLNGSESVLLYTPVAGETLQAAVSNSQDGIVLFTAGAQKDFTKKTPAYAMRFDSSSGALVKKNTLYFRSLTGTWFWKSSEDAGSAAWDNKHDTIAYFFSYTATTAGDGKNHQSGHTWLIDGSSLKFKRKDSFWGSSHCFGNSMMSAGDSVLKDNSSFLAMTLGDAIPRSVQALKFNRHRRIESAQCKSIYKGKMYKACTHMYSSPTDVSHWSYKMKAKNVYTIRGGIGDNSVHTEMGHPGLVQVDDGILAFVLGENNPKSYRGWPNPYNAPRDVGFVKVSPDFRTIMSPNTNRSKQTGLNYITDQSPTGESASRLKTFKLSSGRVLISYEIWSPRWYKRTELMELDKDGNVVRGKWDTCEKMRLPPSDDTFVRNGKGIAYAGSDEGLIRYEICAGAECN